LFGIREVLQHIIIIIIIIIIIHIIIIIVDDEQMKTQSADDSMWKCQGHTDVIMETIPASHVVNMLLQVNVPPQYVCGELL
jgi:hypothetical protein